MASCAADSNMFPDANDAFNRLLTAEEESHNRGKQQGLKDGEASGYIEGHDFGSRKGADVGVEIGFYKGYLLEAERYYNSMDAAQASDSIQRKLHSIRQILESIGKLNLRDVSNEDLLPSVQQIGRKFKQVFPGVYKAGTPGSSHHEAF